MSLIDNRAGIDTIDELIKALPRHYPSHNSVGDRLEDEVTARVLRHATTLQTQLPGFWQFVDLLRRRAKFVGQVCEDKRAMGMTSGFDPKREKEVLERMQDSPFYSLFELAVKCFRDVQDYELSHTEEEDSAYVEELSRIAQVTEARRSRLENIIDTDLIDGIMDYDRDCDTSMYETRKDSAAVLVNVYTKDALYNIGVRVCCAANECNVPTILIARSHVKHETAMSIVQMVRNILTKTCRNKS